MGWPTISDLSRLPAPGTDAPTSVRFSPDGSALTYLQAQPGSLVASLWRHELVTGRRVELLGPAAESERDETLSLGEQLQRERRRTATLGVTEYQWLTRSVVPTIAIPMGGRAFVAVADATVAGGAAPCPGIEEAACIVGSPDGRWLAYVRVGDVWLASLSGQGEHRRLSDDARDGISNGLAEYAAAEELGRFEGLWWSWDGSHLAFAHVDEREIRSIPIAHLAEPTPTAEHHRYPFAGGPNARVSLRVARMADSGVVDVPLPLSTGGYLARVIAHPQGGWLVATLPRDQRSLEWHRLEASGTVTPLWIERAEPWINLDDDTRILLDGRVLRTTERSGFRHLELRGAGGEAARQLTDGDWVVTHVVGVDEARGLAYFMANRDGPTERHLYRVALDSTRRASPERLTMEPGWHDVQLSEDGRQWADTWSDLEHGPRLVVGGVGPGDPARDVEPARSAAGELEVVPPELFTVTAADGETVLHAALYRPAQETPAPPCVVWVYGGPHAQYVRRAWDLTAHPLRQYLARAGVAVLVVDNRGSTNRGLAFERPLRGLLGEVEVADQVAAVRQLAERNEIDASRVGITGGSYGGFMTLRTMAAEPGLFRVGVAVAPVTDWAGYDTAYTERYLGLPDDEPVAYAASSVLELASRIRGSLLLIHGAIDENVHLRHSVRLLAALQAADRDVELVLLPADRHRTRSPSGLATRDRRTVRHLLGGLGVPMPPELSAG